MLINTNNNKIEVTNLEVKLSSPNKVADIKSSSVGLTNPNSDVNSNNPSLKKISNLAIAGSDTGGLDNVNQNTLKRLDENEVDLAIKEKDEKERVIYITRNKRIAIFFMIITINIVANFDHGTIPAATEEIRVKLNIDDEKVGLLGTLVYVGNLIGNLN